MTNYNIGLALALFGLKEKDLSLKTIGEAYENAYNDPNMEDFRDIIDRAKDNLIEYFNKKYENKLNNTLLDDIRYSMNDVSDKADDLIQAANVIKNASREFNLKLETLNNYSKQLDEERKELDKQIAKRKKIKEIEDLGVKKHQLDLQAKKVYNQLMLNPNATLFKDLKEQYNDIARQTDEVIAEMKKLQNEVDNEVFVDDNKTPELHLVGPKADDLKLNDEIKVIKEEPVTEKELDIINPNKDDASMHFDDTPMEEDVKNPYIPSFIGQIDITKDDQDKKADINDELGTDLNSVFATLDAKEQSENNNNEFEPIDPKLFGNVLDPNMLLNDEVKVVKEEPITEKELDVINPNRNGLGIDGEYAPEVKEPKKLRSSNIKVTRSYVDGVKKKKRRRIKKKPKHSILKKPKEFLEKIKAKYNESMAKLDIKYMSEELTQKINEMYYDHLQIEEFQKMIDELHGTDPEQEEKYKDMIRKLYSGKSKKLNYIDYLSHSLEKYDYMYPNIVDTLTKQIIFDLDPNKTDFVSSGLEYEGEATEQDVTALEEYADYITAVKNENNLAQEEVETLSR